MGGWRPFPGDTRTPTILGSVSVEMSVEEEESVSARKVAEATRTLRVAGSRAWNVRDCAPRAPVFPRPPWRLSRRDRRSARTQRVGMGPRQPVT